MARFSILVLLAMSLFSVSHFTLFSEQDTLTVQEPPAHATEGWSWSTDCGSLSDPIQIRSISVFPDPPEPGQNLTVTVSAALAGMTVKEGAYADVTVKLGLVKIVKKQYDLCEEARNADANVTCPVGPGDYTVIQIVELPKKIPQAKFAMKVDAYTYDDDALFCVDLMVDYVKKFHFTSAGQLA
ncbi:hypothetical protein FA95DRAFT_1505197 [Auriscalpium vulgare]|uniref:Uncharacterized protein n=1 Tax=Auriscalpium vulgare TaxID=40419 RepID=A0ACB8R515_9AGAM|nr:hypothetical protein FA95DRAFT_1505197 [Auriscalpium vulgare]